MTMLRCALPKHEGLRNEQVGSLGAVGLSSHSLSLALTKEANVLFWGAWRSVLGVGMRGRGMDQIKTCKMFVSAFVLKPSPKYPQC